MPFMPSFRRRPSCAAIVGRLIAGYGELEFVLAWCAGTSWACSNPIPNGTTPYQHRIAGEHEGVRRIFLIRGESKRIDAAKRLIQPVASASGLNNDYVEIMGAFKSCLRIRNMFAHCSWDQSKKRGLFFVDLEEHAKSGNLFPMNTRHADAKTLHSVERYFLYTMHCVDYLSHAIAIKNRLMRGPFPSRPRKMPGLKSNSLLFPYRNPTER